LAPLVGLPEAAKVKMIAIIYNYLILLIEKDDLQFSKFRKTEKGASRCCGSCTGCEIDASSVF
jgi:hypothetical protein